MSDTFPSTPLSASTRAHPSSAGSNPPSTSRHLKRLSLSTTSTFSPSSPASPASSSVAAARAGSATPQTPLGAERRANQSVRGLRLSQGGGEALSADAASSLGASPAGLLASADEHGSTSSPTLLRRSASYRSSPAVSQPGTPPLDGARTPRSAHARRQSSISYGPRSSLDGASGLNGLGLGGLAEEPAAQGRRSLDGLGLEGVSVRTSLEGVREEPDAEPENLDANPLARSTSRPASMAGPSPAIAQATLVEQNTDLLSFIAKKERKCLDLREELKRHEGELALLKKKWESIVARSLQQQHSQASLPHARNASISTSSSASPHTSPTPRSAAILHPAATAHSLDLSLLSSTFDPTDLDAAGLETPPIELPESVKAAGNWLGSTLGRVLDAAVGFPGDERANGLEILREEDEEAEEGAEEEQRGRRRESKGSSVETEGGTDLYSPVAGARSTAPSSVASEDTVASPQPTQGLETPHKPSPLRAKPTPPRSASPSTTRRERLFTPTSPSAANALSQSVPPSASSGMSHSRSRSTALDALSGGWSSLGKRWNALQESEVVRNSRKSAMGLVDTFEQGLAQALGPLEPPRLDPLPESNRRASPGSARVGSADIPSPFLAAAGSPSAARHSEFPPAATTTLPGVVAGQGLASVFSSWSAASSPSTSSSQLKPSAPAAPTAPPAQPPSFDWSAFLPSSSSASSDLDAQAQMEPESPTKSGERRRSSIVREVTAAKEKLEPAPEEGEEDWPGW
ncbi:hypothetical protein JCM10213_006281 [Rhodosporidiobolus nylandii]